MACFIFRSRTDVHTSLADALAAGNISTSEYEAIQEVYRERLAELLAENCVKHDSTSGKIETESKHNAMPPTKAGTVSSSGCEKDRLEYECEFDCGFQGPFDLVSDHEESCRHNPKNHVKFIPVRRINSDGVTARLRKPRPGSAVIDGWTGTVGALQHQQEALRRAEAAKRAEVEAEAKRLEDEWNNAVGEVEYFLAAGLYPAKSVLMPRTRKDANTFFQGIIYPGVGPAYQNNINHTEPGHADTEIHEEDIHDLLWGVDSTTTPTTLSPNRSSMHGSGLAETGNHDINVSDSLRKSIVHTEPDYEQILPFGIGRSSNLRSSDQFEKGNNRDIDEQALKELAGHDYRAVVDVLERANVAREPDTTKVFGDTGNTTSSFSISGTSNGTGTVSRREPKRERMSHVFDYATHNRQSTIFISRQSGVYDGPDSIDVASSGANLDICTTQSTQSSENQVENVGTAGLMSQFPSDAQLAIRSARDKLSRGILSQIEFNRIVAVNQYIVQLEDNALFC